MFCVNCGTLLRGLDVRDAIECEKCGSKNYIIHDKMVDKDDVELERIERDDTMTILFNSYHLKIYGLRSPKTGSSLKKLLEQGKESLTEEELNLLYKLRAIEISALREKVEYLKAKMRCIKLLREVLPNKSEEEGNGK